MLMNNTNMDHRRPTEKTGFTGLVTKFKEIGQDASFLE